MKAMPHTLQQIGNRGATLVVARPPAPRIQRRGHVWATVARLSTRAMAFTFMLGLVGCTSTRQPANAPGSPGERGPDIGIEVCWWVVDDSPLDDKYSSEQPVAPLVTSQTLREVLTPYLPLGVPVPQATQDAWSANGLRIISVPRADLEKVRSRLRLVGPIQQQWLGEVPQWTEAVRGPAWNGQLALTLDNGTVQLSGGLLRMLVRCWAVPSAPVPAKRLVSPAQLPGALQVELVPQHVDGRAERADLAKALSGTLRPPRQAEGVVFSRLHLESALTGDHALLIVPERPGAQWIAENREGPQEAPVSEPTSNAPVSQVGEPIGPPVPLPPTLGEVMLTDLVAGGRRGARVVLVIVPSAPKSFNLLAHQ